MKQTAIIKTALLALFLFFKSSIIPRPELTSNPASKAPNEMSSSANNFVISRLEAQLGIKPIIEANNGVKYLLEVKKVAKVSHPMKPIINPRARLITNT